jgi:glycosyltransferase involved in cell wall biosynthesis
MSKNDAENSKVTAIETISKSKSLNRKVESPAMGITESTSVCIIVENLSVPLDRRVWCEARALRDTGYAVSVICPKGKKSCTASHEVLDGIHIYRHRMWEASSTLGYLLEYIFALIAEFYLVLKVFTHTRFRVLQGCNPPDTIFLIGLLLKPFGVRFIFDHHDLSPELFEAKFGKSNWLLSAFTRFAEKCSFKVADVSIATNDAFKEVAVTRGGKHPDRVFVVRNCPDIANLHRAPLQPEIKCGKPLLVVYVGFMGKQDGLDLLLQSIEHLVKHEKRVDTHFVLVGGGTVLPELRATVAQKELESFVTFTGQVTHDEVVVYLSNADLGVAPDPKTPMNDNSTMIKIFEYMAFELPLVLFDLKEGRNAAGSAALYASNNDPIDFAGQMTRLLDSSELRQELGALGRKRIEENFNWEAEKMTLLRAYSAALQDNQVAREHAPVQPTKTFSG